MRRGNTEMTTPDGSVELPVLNVDLLSQVVDFAEQHQRIQNDGIMYNQLNWREAVYPSSAINLDASTCGTSMCIAGITCHLTNAQWLVSVDDSRFYSYWGGNRLEYVHVDDDDDPGCAITLHNSITNEDIRVVNAAYRAQRLLGLTKRERHELFSGLYTTVDRLHKIVDRIKNGVYRQPGWADDDE
jgi:hypothetical protein